MLVAAPLLAQTTLPEWAAPIGSIGITGAVLYWFMRYSVVSTEALRKTVQDELRLQGDRIEGLARVQLMLVLKMAEPKSVSHEEASRELARLDRSNAPKG